MPYIPPEVVAKAKQMDLYTYLKTYEPQELVHFGGSTYCTREHDSLKISNGKWYWFSRGIGGRSALDYLIKVKGIPFIEAVEVIVGRGVIPPPAAPCTPKENKVKSLCLPEASRCATHAVNYLTGRGIDCVLLDFCFATGRLYESQKYHNVVFVGQDKYGKPRYANLRGIGTDFKGEASGSDKRFSFSIPAAENSDTLHLFESAIDLLSYATLRKQEGMDWQTDHMVSLAGVYRPRAELRESSMPMALTQYLKDHPGIKKIVLRLDNDYAGRMAAKALTVMLSDEKPLEQGILFSDFMLQWLEIVKPTIAVTTYSSYSNMVKGVIAPYFKVKGISLGDLKATDIQAFYMEQLKRVSPNSVIHYHANIHKALKYAVKIDLIPTNPADKVERPKKNRFIGSFYDSDEVEKLFTAAKGTHLEIPIFLGAFYGLRRSEALGLKWSAIDFQNDTITIRHTVTSCNLDGKHVQIAQDTTKTKSSMRTLPLVPAFKEKLLAHKKQQDEYRRVCGKCYDKRYLDYICVDEMGTLISPHYLTSAFPKLLDKNALRHIRFHDLRHSCASLLLSNGVPMKQIQEWLGHSDFSTTANVYAHLDYNSKLSSADAMVNGLKGALTAIQ